VLWIICPLHQLGQQLDHSATVFPGCFCWGEGTAPLGDKAHLLVAVYSGGFIATSVIGSSSQTLVIHPWRRHRRGGVPPNARCLPVPLPPGLGKRPGATRTPSRSPAGRSDFFA
jgi:hypothetical protein